MHWSSDLKLQQQFENERLLNQAAAQGLQLLYGQITWQSGGGTAGGDAYRYVLIDLQTQRLR